MRIKLEQLEILDKPHFDQFRNDCLTFISENFPDYFQLHESFAHLDLIDEVISFGEKYGIYNPLSIQKLIAIQIMYKFLDKKPMPLHLERTVNHELREEDEKINRLHKQLIYDNNY